MALMFKMVLVQSLLSNIKSLEKVDFKAKP
jgi:hypothetical protein